MLGIQELAVIIMMFIAIFAGSKAPEIAKDLSKSVKKVKHSVDVVKKEVKL